MVHMMHTQYGSAETQPWFTILEGMGVYTVHLTLPFKTPIRPLLLDYIMQSKSSFLRQFPEHFLEDLLAIVQIH